MLHKQFQQWSCGLAHQDTQLLEHVSPLQRSDTPHNPSSAASNSCTETWFAGDAVWCLETWFSGWRLPRSELMSALRGMRSREMLCPPRTTSL